MEIFPLTPRSKKRVDFLSLRSLSNVGKIIGRPLDRPRTNESLFIYKGLLTIETPKGGVGLWVSVKSRNPSNMELGTE